MKVSVKVEGLRELESALSQLEKRATRTAVARRALKKAGEPVAEAMRALAPEVDGDLRQSITVSTKLASDAGKQAFHQAMKAGLGKAAAVSAMRGARRAAKSAAPPVMMFVGPSTKAFHAHFVEFGTAPHINGGMFKGSQHPGSAPRPFARPAWDAQQGTALRLITEELRSEIMKAVKRQAARKAKG